MLCVVGGVWVRGHVLVRCCCLMLVDLVCLCFTHRKATKLEDAADLYIRAANAYKVAKRTRCE